MDPMPVNPPRAARDYAGALQRAGGQVIEERLHERDRSAVGVGLYASPPYDLAVPALPVSRLSITLTASRVHGGVEGEPAKSYDSGRHAVFLAPAGAAARWRKELPSRHLTLYFRPDALAQGDGDDACQGPTEEPLNNLVMPGVRALADALVAELEAGSPWSAEAADSLGRLLLIRVARQRARRHAGACPLNPALLARVQEYVRAHLGERILVSHLAAVAGLSANRFAHAYTACTGVSPYQFVLEQRLQQAQALLRHGDAPLAQVAAECGFASQQHLTQSMRRRLGMTPARCRQQAAQRGETSAGGAGTGRPRP